MVWRERVGCARSKTGKADSAPRGEGRAWILGPLKRHHKVSSPHSYLSTSLSIESLHLLLLLPFVFCFCLSPFPRLLRLFFCTGFSFSLLRSSSFSSSLRPVFASLSRSTTSTRYDVIPRPRSCRLQAPIYEYMLISPLSVSRFAEN